MPCIWVIWLGASARGWEGHPSPEAQWINYRCKKDSQCLEPELRLQHRCKWIKWAQIPCHISHKDKELALQCRQGDFACLQVLQVEKKMGWKRKNKWRWKRMHHLEVEGECKFLSHLPLCKQYPSLRVCVWPKLQCHLQMKWKLWKRKVKVKIWKWLVHP